MTRDDYEERRKRMDEELRAGVELLQASHAAGADGARRPAGAGWEEGGFLGDPTGGI